MDFKIDTKETFTIIVPTNGGAGANLSGELQQKVEEMRQSGSKNFILDMSDCAGIASDAVDGLVSLQEECYSHEQSLVFTGLSKEAMRVLKESETDVLLNIAPTLKEAVDIISMEILERDLFNEE
jgi:anti-anti-sigma factor